MDISYCGDKTGFPRPGHIYIRIAQFIDGGKYRQLGFIQTFNGDYIDIWYLDNVY